jgi:hypothetical protein
MAPSTPVASLATFPALPEPPRSPVRFFFRLPRCSLKRLSSLPTLRLWCQPICRSRSALHTACVVLLAARPAPRLPGLPAWPRFASHCASRLPGLRPGRSASPRSGRLPVLRGCARIPRLLPVARLHPRLLHAAPGCPFASFSSSARTFCPVRLPSRLPIVFPVARSRSGRPLKAPACASRPCFTRRCVCLPHSCKLRLPLAHRLSGCPVHPAGLVSQPRAACFVRTLHQAGSCSHDRSRCLGRNPHIACKPQRKSASPRLCSPSPLQDVESTYAGLPHPTAAPPMPF